MTASATVRQRVPKPAAFVVLGVLILVFPLVAPVAITNAGIFVIVYATASIGLSLLMGLAGQVSLGHAGFFAIGAYAQALLVTKAGVAPELAALLAVGLAAVSAGALGFILLRLRGHYLALTTLGFGIILAVVANESDFTGGPSGVANVPKLEVLGLVFSDPVQFTWLVGAALLVGLVLASNLVHSRTGRALSAVSDSEIAAEVLGVDTFRLRHQVFVVSAIYAAVAGVLYAHWISVVTPDTAGVSLSIEFLLICVIGGLGTVWGAVLGSIVVVALREILQRLLPLILPSAAGEIELIGYGLLLIVLLLWLPGGLHQLWVRLPRMHPRPAETAVHPLGDRLNGPASEVGGFAVTGRRSYPDRGSVLLDVQSVTKRFGGLTAVNAVSLQARAGEILALIGPNGAGKTTLFNLVSGVLPVSGGKVVTGAERLDGRPPHVFARAGATRTFQNLQIFRSATALGNVMVGRHLRTRSGLVASALSFPARTEEKEIVASAHRILDLVGLSDVADRPAAELPFGRQRVLELARALALEPDLLLLDEPLAGLSGAERTELVGVLRRLRSEGMGIVIVEHDVDAVLALADRIAVLENGRLIAEGDPATIRTDPATIAAYLGSENSVDVPTGAPVAMSAASSVLTPRLASVPTRLAVSGLRAAYGSLEVLHGVDLEVRSGELVAVLGANGAGKTSLLRAISSLINVTGGSLILAGQPLARSPEAVAASGIAHVPENRLVFPSLSVRENLLLGAWTRRGEPRLATSASIERVLDLFPRLRERLNQAAGTMSGGEQQMLAIARGLMADPRVLLLDEPSLGLAPRIVGEIFAALARLKDEHRLAILLIEQNARAAFRIADRVYLMERGRIAAHGAADDLQDDESIQRAYLGGSYAGVQEADPSDGRGG